VTLMILRFPHRRSIVSELLGAGRPTARSRRCAVPPVDWDQLSSGSVTLGQGQHSAGNDTDIDRKWRTALCGSEKGADNGLGGVYCRTQKDTRQSADLRRTAASTATTSASFSA